MLSVRPLIMTHLCCTYQHHGDYRLVNKSVSPSSYVAAESNEAKIMRPVGCLHITYCLIFKVTIKRDITDSRLLCQHSNNGSDINFRIRKSIILLDWGVNNC